MMKQIGVSSSSDMTLDFINKRIKEQKDYLQDIFLAWIKDSYTEERYMELYDSAKAQLDYFEQKKKEHEAVTALVQNQLT